MVDSLASDAGIRRHVEVLTHKDVPGPMTCGAVRPTIMLPDDARSWPAEELKRAIVHELEHVRRGDRGQPARELSRELRSQIGLAEP